MAEATKHSKIGASSMYRWSKCPGSVRLCEGIVAPQSKYAEEGTKAHEIAASWLNHYPQRPGEEALDDDTKSAVHTYVETVMSDFRKDFVHELPTLFIEVQFDLSEIFPGLFGTVDAGIYSPYEKLLRIYDYKHGQGIIVEAEKNVQLSYYGLGALLTLKKPVDYIELVIVQPRAAHVEGPVRRWRFKSADILEFEADLRNFAKKTTDPQAPLIPGDHCRFCAASGICPALSEKALAIAQNEFSPVVNYDPQKLSQTLAQIDVLESYAKSVREFAYNEAVQGRCPPGFKLVEKRAVRRWKDELTAGAYFHEFYGKEAFEMDLKSPAQMEKIAPKDVVGKFTVAVSSGLVLVPESDKRPVANDPAKDFVRIEE